MIKENYNGHGKFKHESGMNKTLLELEDKDIHLLADSRGNDTALAFAMSRRLPKNKGKFCYRKCQK